MDTIVYLIRHSEQFRGYKEKYNSQQQNEKIVLSINGERLAEELSKIPEIYVDLHNLKINMVFFSFKDKNIDTKE